MTNQPFLIPFRDILAELYPTEQDARVVVYDSGLVPMRITFSSRAQTNWHNILTEAIYQNRLDNLLQIVNSTYGNNLSFQSIYSQYLHNIDHNIDHKSNMMLSDIENEIQEINRYQGPDRLGNTNVFTEDLIINATFINQAFALFGQFLRKYYFKPFLYIISIFLILLELNHFNFSSELLWILTICKATLMGITIGSLSDSVPYIKGQNSNLIIHSLGGSLLFTAIFVLLPSTVTDLRGVGSVVDTIMASAVGAMVGIIFTPILKEMAASIIIDTED